MYFSNSLKSFILFINISTLWRLMWLILSIKCSQKFFFRNRSRVISVKNWKDDSNFIVINSRVNILKDLFHIFSWYLMSFANFIVDLLKILICSIDACFELFNEGITLLFEQHGTLYVFIIICRGHSVGKFLGIYWPTFVKVEIGKQFRNLLLRDFAVCTKVSKRL